MAGLFELWNGEKKDRIRMLKLRELVDYREGVFSGYDGERLKELKISIESSGVLTPIVVRELDDGYEILSGHARVMASREIGFKHIPGIILEDVSEAEARYIATESNVAQRGFMELKISERAKCARCRYDAMKGLDIRDEFVEITRSMLEKYPEVRKPIDEMDVKDEFKLDERSMYRYVRIDCLTTEMKELVDSGKVYINCGVNFSYLSEEHQLVMCEIAEAIDRRISVVDSVKIRELERAKIFSREAVMKILDKKGKLNGPVQVRQTVLKKYFIGYSHEEIDLVIEKALENYLNI